MAPLRLIGRDRLMAVLARAREEFGVRILNLHGLGGIGKTSLAKAFGAASGAVQFVDIDVDAGRKIEVDRRCATLILDGVTAASRDRVQAWMEAVPSPDTTLLVTSRHRLDLPDAHAVLVGPLDDESALAMLVACARQHQLDFDPDTEAHALGALSRALGGWPLAITHAARCLGVFSAAELTNRIVDNPEVLTHPAELGSRTTSAAACLGDAWDALPDGIRSALSQCTVFAGSFTLAMAEAVLALDADWPVWVAVDRLVATGLVRAHAGTPRTFQVSDLVRQFVGRQRPLADGSVRRRYADVLIERAGVLARPTGWCQALIGSAPFDTTLDLKDLEPLCIAPELDVPQRRALTHTAFALALLHEDELAKRRIIDAAWRSFGHPEDAVGPFVLARTVADSHFGRHAEEIELLERTIDAAQAREQWMEAALLAICRARIAREAGQIEAGQETAQHASRWASQTKDPRFVAWTDQASAMLTLRIGTVPERVAAAKAMVRACREHAWPAPLVGWLDNLAVQHFEAGELARSWAMSKEAATLASSAGDVNRLVAILVNMSETAIAERRIDDAQRCLQEAEQLRGGRHVALGSHGTLTRAWSWLALAEDDLVTAASVLRRGPDDPTRDSEQAVAHLGHAMVALRRGEDHVALGRLDEAERLQESLRTIRSDWSIELALRAVALARTGALPTAGQALLRAHEEATRWESRRFLDVQVLADAAVALCRAPEAGRASAFRALARARGEVDPALCPYVEVRVLQRIVEDLLDATSEQPVVRVGAEVAWVQVGAERRVSLLRSPVSRRLVTAMVDAHGSGAGPVQTTELLHAGWPESRLARKTLEARLWVALSKLRSQGLGLLVQRTPDGYRIEPNVRLERVPATVPR